MRYDGPMIASLKGIVTHSSSGFVVLDVHNVGYRVQVTEEVRGRLKIGSDALLWTHAAIRENSHELYGFQTHTDVTFFEMLISVSGIGPKSALAIMNLEQTERLAQAIARGDTSYLTKVSGIGKKSAEKIIVELRDKMLLRDGTGDNGSGDGDAIDALRTLGYSIKEAREALKSVPAEIEETGDRLKEALKLLGTK